MRLAAIVAFLLLFSPAVLAGPLDVEGRWLTEGRNAIVDIRDCGDGTPCGVLAWVDMTEASSDRDINNPDPKLNGRPLIGMPMLTGFRDKGSNWGSGNIYDPESGKTYGSNIRLKSDGTLQVKGCVGPFCQTQIWTRAKD